jgi:hypothetical protein
MIPDQQPDAHHRRLLATATASAAGALANFVVSQNEASLALYRSGHNLISVSVLLTAEGGEWEVQVRLTDPTQPDAGHELISHVRGRMEDPPAPPRLH